jgi:predicted amidohydrolase YtcJ
VNPNLPRDELERALVELGPPGQSWEGGLFRADGLAEVGLDGAELTAMLRQPYPERPDYYGLQKVPQKQFNMFCELAAKHGWRPSPHAVGDAAIDEALEAFYHAQSIYPEVRLRRWMLGHAFLMLPDHYDDVKDLGLFINSQYMHNAQLGRRILAAWGRELADKSEMYGDWVKNGIIFGNGADGPISYYAEPLLYIWGSVTRGTLWGGSLGPDQGLSREDAIRSVTAWSAFGSFEENVKGTIEPGKYADFVVLSDDIMSVPAEQIRNLQVLATVLGGKTVHGDLDL